MNDYTECLCQVNRSCRHIPSRPSLDPEHYRWILGNDNLKKVFGITKITNILLFHMLGGSKVLQQSWLFSLDYKLICNLSTQE